jgi:early secretory antigenic target protein ESAT-6
MDNGLLLVNFGALQQASADIQKALNTMQAQLSQLARDAGPLVATWSGAAQAAYAERQRKWTAASEDLASAIRQAFETSIYHAGVKRRQSSGLIATDGPASGLTKREIEILRLVAEGYSNSQLAKMLWVTEQTVKFHLSNIYRKLDVANRTEASRWAQLHGLLPQVTGQSAA